MKSLFGLWILLLCAFISFDSLGQIYYTRLSGNWNDPSTWSQVGFAGAAATSFPTAGSVVNVGGGFTVTVNTNSACASLIYQGNTASNNAVSLNAGTNLTVSGPINLANGGSTNGVGINALAVGDGTLLANGSINFINGGGSGAHTLAIASGTANITGDVTGGIGPFLTSIIFTGAGQLNLGGKFLNSTNGTLVQGTGTVTYKGSVAQTIGDFTYYNLTLNNTAGTTGQLALANNITVTNTLTMISGIVNLDGGTLTLGSSGVASTLTRTTSTTTNWMYGGSFRRYWLSGVVVSSTAGNLYGLFPVGTSSASSYRPVQINSTGSPTANGDYLVTHTNVAGATDLNPVYDDNPSNTAVTNIVRKVNAQFNNVVTGATGGTFKISATMTGLAPTGDIADIRLAVSSGATTVKNVGTHVVPTTGTVSNPTPSRSGLSTANLTGDFRITTTNAANTPLPIELVSFEGEVVENTVHLNWETASELNNDFFTVERSAGGEAFTSIGQVAGAGTTNQGKKYSLIDYNPVYGTNYYRLKQTDFDGTFTHSAVLNIEFTGISSSFKIYPNPTINYTFVFELAGASAGVEVPLRVINAMGATVFDFTYTADQNGRIKGIVDLNPVAVGVYMVRIPAAGISERILIR